MAKHVVPGTGVEGLPISDAVRAGDFVFLSGLVGFGPRRDNRRRWYRFGNGSHHGRCRRHPETREGHICAMSLR